MSKSSAVRSRFLAIVDDDPGALTALRFLLELEGYRISAFRSGREFLEATDRGLPDCLVLDQNMPCMTGLEVAGALRRTGKVVPTVIITAMPNATLTQAAKNAGIDCIVEKPIFGGALNEAIERCLGSDPHA